MLGRNRVSDLQQIKIDEQEKINGSSVWKGNRCFFVFWLTIGMLAGTIPLATILSLYLSE